MVKAGPGKGKILVNPGENLGMRAMTHGSLIFSRSPREGSGTMSEADRAEAAAAAAELTLSG